MSRVGYSYPKFYGALHAADLVLPAFGKTTYDKDRASSTMGVAGTARVSASRALTPPLPQSLDSFHVV